MEVGDVVKGNRTNYEVVKNFNIGRSGVEHYLVISNGDSFFLKRYLEERENSDFVHETSFFEGVNGSQHPNIIYPSEVIPRTRDMIFPYMDGGCLGKFYGDRRLLAIDSIGSVVENIGSALSSLHEREMVHLDVKLDNMLFRNQDLHFIDGRIYNMDGEIFLIDFGCVQEIGYQSGGLAFGSPYTISPEMLRGRTVDQRSDIYGLAASVYEMISGDIAYADSNIRKMLEDVVFADVPRIEVGIREGVTKEMSDLICFSMAKNPNERPEAVDDFVKFFRQAM